MATALQGVALKLGKEPLLKFRTGTKVDYILHHLTAVCPSASIEDTEGFVVTVGYLENLTQKEHTVIDPSPAGASIYQLLSSRQHCLHHTMTPTSKVLLCARHSGCMSGHLPSTHSHDNLYMSIIDCINTSHKS